VADLSRFLPLSNRPKGDEAGVTSDRRVPLAAVVEEAARLLDAAPDRAARAADFARNARLGDAATSVASPADLRTLAATIAAGRRQSTKTLARSVRALLLLSGHLGAQPRIDGTTLGIVSLYGATSAPLERRAVVGGHALRATDAGWEFGRGPVLEGTALDIARFVLGVSDIPPKPPAGPTGPTADD
jgi:hypothetical protein